MTKWVEGKLGDVCHVYQPETISQKRLVAGPYPVYGANGQIGWHNEFNHEAPELLLGCRGTCGSVHFSQPKSWVNGNAMVVRPLHSKLDIDFLAYALKGGIDIRAAITGAAQPQITRTSLMPLPIRYPEDISEQRRIVDLLSRAEGIVRLRREAQRKASELMPALFLDMFGDPTSNPKSWPVVAFADVIGFTRYGPRFPNREYSATLKGGRVLRTTDIKSDGSISADQAPMLPMTDEEIEKYSLEANTIVVTRTGATIGKVALYEKSDGAAVAGAYLIEVRLNERVLPRYVLHLLMSEYGQQKLSSGARAVAQPNLNVPTIAAIPIPVPPLELQRSFAAKVESMHGISAQQETALATSQATFDALLQRVFAR